MRHINIEDIQKNMFGDRSAIKQFLSLYLTQTPKDLSNLKVCLESGDRDAIAGAAHHIKPTMDYIGATHPRKQLQEIETLAKEGASITKLTATYQLLEPKIEELLEEINAYEKTL